MINAENTVSPAITAIELDIPKKSARTPVNIAPTAYPKSRHNRKTPMLLALSFGWVFSATADKKVGYTKAVPKPNTTDKVMYSNLVRANK